MKVKITEFSIQRDIFKWAELNYKKYRSLDLMYATGGGLKLPIGLAVKAKMSGILKQGVPDIVLPVARKGYHGLYIELKKERGKPSVEQIEYLNRLKKEGYLATFAYGFDQAIRIVEEYYD